MNTTTCKAFCHCRFCLKLCLDIFSLIHKWHWWQVHPTIHLPCQWRTNLTSDHSNNILIEFPNHEKPSNGVSFMSQLDLRSLKQHFNWIPRPWKPLKWCIIYKSSSLSFIPVIYIQLDGGHVGFCQDGSPIGLTWPQIIKTTSGLASPTLYTPKLMNHSWF